MNTATMTIQQQYSSQNNQSQQSTPFQVLKIKVYPVINNVILKLIDHIVKSHEVQKHQERLKKKKLLDQLQKKYLQREIEKQQMGSDYQQSDDTQYYKRLEMKKQQVQGIIKKRLTKKTKVRKSSDADDHHDLQLEELGQNVFNPIQFIVDQLKRYQQLKKQNRLNEFQPKQQQENKLNSKQQEMK